jgi:predicted short-subunit dehydrogenase-like oxidoreductase (DUF2520 family)
MTLTFQNSRTWFDRDRRGIAFTADDDRQVIQFLISVEALEALGLRGDPEQNAASVFEAHRRHIQNVAAAKLARGEVILVAADFPQRGQGMPIED